MSYILEALKKAQAERQLGSAPTIHSVTPHAVPARAGSGRKPLLMGLGAGALAASLAAFLLMRAPAPPPVPAPAAALQVSAPGALPPAEPAAPQVAVPAEPVARAALRKPPPAPVAPVATPMPARPAEPAPARPATARVAAVPEPVAPAPPPVRAEPAVPASPPPAPLEDSAPALGQLPESIQRDVPQVRIGGYIYSANPADRLLLIDKVLRREGEEVAPGLSLERLLPKAAIMNYRGYRYRIPL